MHILILLILLTSGLSTQASDYRRYINKRVRPLHDLLLQKHFLVIPNPPTCETNHLMRGYFISRYRAIYLMLRQPSRRPKTGRRFRKRQVQRCKKAAEYNPHTRGCSCRPMVQRFQRLDTFNLEEQHALEDSETQRLTRPQRLEVTEGQKKETYLLESQPEIVMEAFDLYCQPLSFMAQKRSHRHCSKAN